MRTIKEFIRDDCGKPYGCMVATVVDVNGVEMISVGVSICHEHDKNKWSKSLASEIAMGRAESVNCQMRLPIQGHVWHSRIYNANALDFFLSRCRAYFQNKPIILPNIVWF